LRHEQIAATFNEWQRRYAADPDAFDAVLDDRGRPVVDYGERCAHYFVKIMREMYPGAGSGGIYKHLPGWNWVETLGTRKADMRKEKAEQASLAKYLRAEQEARRLGGR
jgi:hypothetical protein